VSIEFNVGKNLHVTQDDTMDKKGKSLKYGPFNDMPPLSYEKLRVHYVHD